MQVRKRNGDDEPVDVNKIVRAVDRVCDDLADVDPMRVATRTISGLYDGATTAELDRLSIQTAAEMIGEEPQYSRLAARLLAGYIDKEVRNQGVMSFSQSIALGHAEGLIGDDDRAVRQGQRPQARLRDRRRRRPPVRVLRAAHRLRPLPAAAPVEPAGGRDPAVLPAAGRLRPRRRRPAEAIEFYRLMSSLAYLPSSPTLFNSGTRHTQMSSLLPRRQPARRPRLDLLALPAGRPALEVRRRHRHRVLAGPLARRADPRHQRRVQRHRPVPAHPRLVGGGGQPGRPPQGRRLRLPRAVAPRRRGVPRAARQHRRGRAPHAQPQPGQLDPRRVHAPGRGRRGVVAHRPRPGARSCPTCGARPSTRRTAGPRRTGRYVRQVKARELYGKMMRTLAQTGNGWMTFKDAANRTCNQTSDPSGSGGPVVHLSNLCTEIIEVSSDAETAVCNLGSINLGPARRDRRGSTGRSCAPRSGRRCRCSTGSSTSTTTRARRPRRPTRSGGRSASA